MFSGEFASHTIYRQADITDTHRLWLENLYDLPAHAIQGTDRQTDRHHRHTQMMKWCLMSSDASWHIRDKLWPMPKHGFNHSLRPRKPEGSLGRTAQDGHLDSHTAPELWHTQGVAGEFIRSASAYHTRYRLSGDNSGGRACALDTYKMVSFLSVVPGCSNGSKSPEKFVVKPTTQKNVRYLC